MNNTSQITNYNLFSNTSRLGTFIIVLLWFILNAIGIYRVAKRENVKLPWLAWIPLIQYYTLGEIVQNKSKIKYLGFILFLSQTILFLYFYFLPLNLTTFLIYLVLLIGSYIIFQYALNLYYKLVDPDKAFLYLVLGILFPFLIPIWIFALSKDKSKDNFYYD